VAVWMVFIMELSFFCSAFMLIHQGEQRQGLGGLKIFGFVNQLCLRAGILPESFENRFSY
jgi:hypothetical protein